MFTLNNRTIRIVAAAAGSLVLATAVSARIAPGADQVRSARTGQAAASPVHCLVAHRVGQIELGVANNGTFGNNYHPGPRFDWFTGEQVPSCEYPKNSDMEYLYGAAFWIGAVIGRDTLVSVGADGWGGGAEMYPDEEPFGEIVYRSITDPTKPEFNGAISEEDYIAVYMDTLTEGVLADAFGRPHMPLNIEITQASYAWSYSYAEDFVLFDYKIRNIGSRNLNDVYMGIYVDADVCFDCVNSRGFADDICGFLYRHPSRYGACDYVDTVFTAWIADNDGDFNRIHNDGQFHPCPAVTATRIVRTPSDSLDVSFNWWIGNMNPSLCFGPRERPFMGRRGENFRDFGTGGLGTPEGDVNKYYVMRNQEFDYDQIRTAVIQPGDTLWQYPNQELADDFADGFDTRYLISFGPFHIRPEQTLPVSFAYVGGEDFHGDNDNVSNLPGDPDEYYRNVDFTDLAANSQWASWIYDNPGVDTDGNGYYGKMRICCTDSLIILDTLSESPLQVDTGWNYTVCDTFYYEGDGVPDFRGASPPPPPDFWIDRRVGSLTIRFNGLRSETTRDVFSREFDFEGYRVYLARDDRASSFTLVASYDREDYNKFVWNDRRIEYELQETPFTLEELRCLYGESCNDGSFQPLDFTRNRPYEHPLYPDSQFYFAAQDFNASVFGVTTPIRKIYRGQPYPTSLCPDSARPEELTEDGHLKYFEYEFTIADLLPTVPYWVNVTAFDYGSPESGLESLESSVTLGMQNVYALSPWDEVQRDNLDVFVYPNPYRGDGEYRERGLEGRTEIVRPPDRVRAIHFANVPPRCTIRIYTIDGDLVREIENDKQPRDGTATQAQWNLITRNTQTVVSGLYYWSVEDHESGRIQMGKFVIIM